MIRWLRSNNVAMALKMITLINALAGEVERAVGAGEVLGDGSRVARLYQRLLEQRSKYESLKTDLDEDDLLRLLDSETTLWNGCPSDVITWETHLAHLVDKVNAML